MTWRKGKEVYKERHGGEEEDRDDKKGREKIRRLETRMKNERERQVG